MKSNAIKSILPTTPAQVVVEAILTTATIVNTHITAITLMIEDILAMIAEMTGSTIMNGRRESQDHTQTVHHRQSTLLLYLSLRRQ